MPNAERPLRQGSVNRRKRRLEASRASFPTSLVALGRGENDREKTQETGQKTFLWNGIWLRSKFVDVAMNVHGLSPPTRKDA
jgi:hypothetical protein